MTYRCGLPGMTEGADGQLPAPTVIPDKCRDCTQIRDPARICELRRAHFQYSTRSKQSRASGATYIWFPDLAVQLCCRPSGMTVDGMRPRGSLCRHPGQVQALHADPGPSAYLRASASASFKTALDPEHSRASGATYVWFPDLAMQLCRRSSGLTGGPSTNSAAWSPIGDLVISGPARCGMAGAPDLPGVKGRWESGKAPRLPGFWFPKGSRERAFLVSAPRWWSVATGLPDMKRVQIKPCARSRTFHPLRKSPAAPPGPLPRMALPQNPVPPAVERTDRCRPRVEGTGKV